MATESDRTLVPSLSDEEIDLLMQGLDAIADKDKMGEAMAGMLIAQLTRGNPEALARFEEESKNRDMAMRRARQDRCTLIKAKLIQYRQSRNATDFGIG